MTTSDVAAWPTTCARLTWRQLSGVVLGRRSGLHYYRVRIACGRICELYYDRAPKGVDDRKGTWVLFREMAEGT